MKPCSSDKHQSEGSHLSDGRRLLGELIRSIHFGRIENLTVRSGEPQFGRGETVVREVKFGGENGTADLAAVPVLVDDKAREMFAHFDALGDCVLRYLEVKHGRPFKMNVVIER